MDSKKIAVVVVAAVLVIAIAAAGIVYLGMGKALDETDSTLVSVVIPSGATADSIAQALEDNHVIDKASDFKLWSKVKGYDSQYKAGTYALSAAMDFDTIADILVGGKVSMSSFTVPEGLTVGTDNRKTRISGDGYERKLRKRS